MRNILIFSVGMNIVLLGLFFSSMSKRSSDNEKPIVLKDTIISAHSDSCNISYSFQDGILRKIEINYDVNSHQMVQFHSNGMVESYSRRIKLNKLDKGTQLYDIETVAVNNSGKIFLVDLTEENNLILDLYRTEDGSYYQFDDEHNEILVFEKGQDKLHLIPVAKK